MTLGKLRYLLSLVPHPLFHGEAGGSEMFFLALHRKNIYAIVWDVLEKNPEAAVKLLKELPLSREEKGLVKATLCTFRKEGK